jgi:hypothetical protein
VEFLDRLGNGAME